MNAGECIGCHDVVRVAGCDPMDVASISHTTVDRRGLWVHVVFWDGTSLAVRPDELDRVTL